VGLRSSSRRFISISNTLMSVWDQGRSGRQGREFEILRRVWSHFFSQSFFFGGSEIVLTLLAKSARAAGTIP